MENDEDAVDEMFKAMNDRYKEESRLRQIMLEEMIATGQLREPTEQEQVKDEVWDNLQNLSVEQFLGLYGLLEETEEEIEGLTVLTPEQIDKQNQRLNESKRLWPQFRDVKVQEAYESMKNGLDLDNALRARIAKIPDARKRYEQERKRISERVKAMDAKYREKRDAFMKIMRNKAELGGSPENGCFLTISGEENIAAFCPDGKPGDQFVMEFQNLTKPNGTPRIGFKLVKVEPKSDGSQWTWGKPISENI